MKSAPRIFNPRKCERNYYQMVEVDLSPIWTSDPSAYIDPASELVPDMVTIDMPQQDLTYLLELERQHRRAQQDPRVRAAWDQYQTILKLTEKHQ